MAPVQGPEIQFAQRLASNEKSTRSGAIKKLRKYITVRSQKGKEGFTNEELLKLWKGLFYCLWMQDKPLLQEELSNNISCLLNNFQTVDGQLLYLETFLQTVKREWNGIDRLRMDKFFQLVRFLFRQTFEMLKKTKWEASVVSKFLELLQAQVLHTQSEAPVGLQLHTLDLYLTELAGVGAAELTAKQNLTFIDPFCIIAAKTKDRVLLSAICKEIFHTIIDQAPFAVQDLLREVKGAGAKESDSGQSSEEDEEIEEEVLEKTKPLKKAAGKQLNGTKSHEDEEDDLDDEEDELLHLEEDSDTEIPDDDDDDEEEDIGPVLQFDYSGLADHLLQLASRSKTPSYNRQKLYKIIKTLRDLSEGVFPQDEYPDEVSTDEDDDMFGSRKSVKRVKKRKGEDVEDTRGPAAKKGKGKEKEAEEADEPNQDSTKDDGEPAADTTVTKKKRKRKKRKAEKINSVGGEEAAETKEINTETDAPAVLPPPADSATDGEKEALMETATSVLVEKPPSVNITDEATATETEAESEILLPLEVKSKNESSVMVTEEPTQKKKKAKKAKSIGGEEAVETKAINLETEAPTALLPPVDSITNGENEAVMETSISVLGVKPLSVNITDEATPTETEGESEILLPLEVKSRNECSVMVTEEPDQSEPLATKDKSEDHEEASTPAVMEGESESLLPLEEKTSVTATEEPSQPELQATEDNLKAQDQSETLSKKKGKRKKSIVSPVDPKPSELAGDTSTETGTEQPEITPETHTSTPAKKKKKAEKRAEKAVGEVQVEGESTGAEIILVSCEASTGETTITSVADTTTPDETTITSVADTTTPGKKRNRKKSLKVEEKVEEVVVLVEGECADAAITSGNCDSSTEDAKTKPLKTKSKREIKRTQVGETSGLAPVTDVIVITDAPNDTTTPAKKKNKKSLKIAEESENQVEETSGAAPVIDVIIITDASDNTTTTSLTETTTPAKKKNKKSLKVAEESENQVEETSGAEPVIVITDALDDTTTTSLTETTTPAKKKNKKSLKVAEQSENQVQVEGGNSAAEIIPVICEALTEDTTTTPLKMKRKKKGEAEVTLTQEEVLELAPVSDASTDVTTSATDTTTPAKKKKNKKSLKVEEESENQVQVEGGNTAGEIIPVICEAVTEVGAIISVEDATPAKKKKNKKSPAEMIPIICETSTEDAAIILVEDTTTPKKKKKTKKSPGEVQEAESDVQIKGEGGLPEAEIAPVESEALTEDASTLPLKKSKKKKKQA